MGKARVSVATRVWIASVVTLLAVSALGTVPVLSTLSTDPILREPGVSIALFVILLGAPLIAVLAVRAFRADAAACSLVRVTAWAWGALFICVYLSFALSHAASRLLSNETGAIVLTYALIGLLVFAGSFAGASFGGRDSPHTP